MRGGIPPPPYVPVVGSLTKYTEFTLIQSHASGTREAQDTPCSGCAIALGVTR
jgi:hypothetical protein